MRTQVIARRQLACTVFDALVHFQADPTEWLPEPAAATDAGWLVTLHAGPASWTVTATVGEVVHDRFTHRRTLAWVPDAAATPHATTTSTLPSFDGHVAVREDADGVEVAVHGTYDIPGGRVGAVLDAAGLHRVAQRTLDHLAAAIADRVSAPLA
jgi:hypothetical protein